MTKVMMALPELDVGGAQILTLNLIREIRRQNDTFQFQILLLEEPHGSYLEKQCANENIEVVYLGKKKGFHPELLPKITQAIKSFSPDVIHMHKSRMHYFLLPIILSGVRTRIYTVHSIAEMDTKSPKLRKIMSFAFKYCHVQPVAISNLCRDSIVNSYGIRQDGITCIYNGIDINKFKNPNKRKAPRKGDLTFISVGRISSPKNYPLMLRVAARVHEKWSGVRFIVLGDGELKNEIKILAKELGADSYVSFMGNVSDVYNYMWKADAFLMTSDFEGLPLTVIEAMAAGLPIVSTKAGGVVDVVKDRENGILADCGCEDQLVDAVETLCASPELCVEYSSKSEELSGQYSLEKMAEGYMQLYLS